MNDADAAGLARRTIAAAILTVVGLALVGVAIWSRRPRLEPIEISQQITYIVTPTRTDGWVDYPGQVNWMRRASLDAGGANAAPALVRALGRDVLPAGVDRDALLAALGIGAIDESTVLKPLREYNAQVGSRRPPASPETSAWLAVRCDVPSGRAGLHVMAWPGAFGAALASLREASKAAGLYVPVSRGHMAGDLFARVNAPPLQNAARALACHAAVTLLKGDAPGSWADAEALWRLGQLLARSATVDEYALALVFWRAAATATVDIAATPSTSPVLLSVMQAGLGAGLGFPPATETWMLHRLAVLEAKGTPLVSSAPPGAMPPGLRARSGTAAKLEAVNGAFDDVDVALQIADPRQRIARVDQLAPATAAAIGISGGAMLAAELRAVSYLRLASLAVALERRARDGGRLPASLAELGQPTRDPGSGGALVYKPDGRRFVIYGVGADGRDDGGDAQRDVVVTAQEAPPLPPLPDP